MNSNTLRIASGGPGIKLRCTCIAKTAAGTTYSAFSRGWYPLDHGGVTEIYYPTIDSLQVRDLQFLVADGEKVFRDERRNFVTQIDCLCETALGLVVRNQERERRYTIGKSILGEPVCQRGDTTQAASCRTIEGFDEQTDPSRVDR